MARKGLAGEIEPADQELADPGNVQPTQKPKGRRSLSRMRREMTDDEMTNPAVQKLLMDDLDRLENEIIDLASFREKFHTSDKECSVLKEKLKPRIAADIFFGGFMTIGSVLIGLAVAVWATPLAGYGCAIAGVLLLMMGIASKVVLR